MAESRGPEVNGVAWTFLVLSSVTSILRFYCRGWVIRAFGLDDWLAVAAQILFILFCTYEIMGVRYGTGQHNASIATEELPKALQMWWTCEPLYVLTNMFIKASIAIFLLRICVNKVHIWVIWGVTVLTEVYSLFFFLLFILQCRPTSYFWLRASADPPSGSCLDAQVVANAFYGYSTISCVTDWAYSLLPIFVVWNLQMNKRLKISASVILAAGTIASSATIVRIPYLHTMTDIDDFLYSTADVAIWSTVETGLGITAAAVATLKPLLRGFLGGGSSADPAGYRSRGPWHRTSSAKNGADDVFELKTPGEPMGVTTVIEREMNGGKDVASDEDIEVGRDGNHDRSDLSGSVKDDWSGSEANLADTTQQVRTENPWNITVKKSVVQTRG